MAITCTDRISELPHPIQHQILSLLSQKDAAGICILSKSWLHHWFTRPNVEFRQWSYNGQISDSLINKTLQRYLDQNLSIHEFRFKVLEYGSKRAADLLRKWIPVLKILNIYLLNDEQDWYCHFKFDVPSSVFEAESLQKLYLERCTMYKECIVNVLCKHLKTLHLEEVNISDENFKKIISSCPLIESVTINYCYGLITTIKVDDKQLCNLKHFEFTTYYGYCRTPRIEFDVPSSVLERIIISCCPFWLRNEYQRNLKSLSLTSVRLSSELFDLFSWKMPSLEFLELDSCYGFKEFHLSSRSIKHLVYKIYPKVYRKKATLIRATIDAPNLLYFDYSSLFPPPVFSFISSHEWKSKVSLKTRNDSSWFLKLYQLLKGLSGSEYSLFLYKIFPPERKTEDKVPYNNNQPVVVEHLELWSPYPSMPSHSDFMKLFGICQPRALVGYEKTEDFLSKFLVMDTRIRKGTAFGNRIWRM